MARLNVCMVDGLVCFVICPEPADDFVAGVQGGLLAFEAGVVGGDVVEEEVLGCRAGDFVGPGSFGPGCGVAFGEGGGVSVDDACM